MRVRRVLVRMLRDCAGLIAKGKVPYLCVTAKWATYCLYWYRSSYFRDELAAAVLEAIGQVLGEDLLALGDDFVSSKLPMTRQHGLVAAQTGRVQAIIETIYRLPRN